MTRWASIRAEMGKGFKTRKGPAWTHALILAGFLAFVAHVAEPWLDSLERIPGESQRKSLRLPAETNEIRYSLDSVSVADPAFIGIQGWAFMEAIDPRNSATYIVLESANKRYVFGAETTIRTDVTRYFQESGLNLDGSGLAARIPTRKIPAGKYRVGIYIKGAARASLKFTDRVIAKRGGTVELAP